MRAIPLGVLGRLAKLTSKTRKNAKSRMNKLYPDPCKALEKAGLINNKKIPKDERSAQENGNFQRKERESK